MVTQFATPHVLALQQTLWHAGTPVLPAAETAELTFAAPDPGAGLA